MERFQAVNQKLQPCLTELREQAIALGREPVADRLLAELDARGAGDRSAAFRCVMALVWPDGRTRTAEGHCPGRIATAPRGEGGFGYDPVFVDPETGRTFAELPAETKNARSHRRRALDALVASLAAPGRKGAT